MFYQTPKGGQILSMGKGGQFVQPFVGRHHRYRATLSTQAAGTGRARGAHSWTADEDQSPSLGRTQRSADAAP